MINSKTKFIFQNDLLDWYQKNARRLPWRGVTDPYQIWVSEIMLQQTRVESVIPYFHRWMETYPDVNALADAEEDQILNLWEGLGYYQRAHNLHQAAKVVAERYQGRIPDDPKTLESLPGIGPYTAGAIASIGFGQKTPLIDGNIRRVFCRFFNVTTPLQERETEELLWKIAAALLPDENIGEFNQALMELGALVCLPKNPDCKNCPLKLSCQANKLNLQHDRPVRRTKRKPPHYQVTAGLIKNGNRLLLAKRPQKGLLGGLWEFPGGTQEEEEDLTDTLIREIREELDLEIKVEGYFGTFSHAYTHYGVTLHVFDCKPISQEIKLNFHTQFRWVKIEDLSDFPMGKLDRMIADKLQG